MAATKRTLQRMEKQALVFGYIRETFNHFDVFPNPLIALCLIFYDPVHYVDFYGNKLKKWINAEPGNITKSTKFRVMTQYGPLRYRLHSGCEQRKRRESGLLQFEFKSSKFKFPKNMMLSNEIIRSESIKECHLYIEIRLNGKLIQKGYNIVDFKHKPRFKVRRGLISSAELRQMDGITFEVYIEFLKVIPQYKSIQPLYPQIERREVQMNDVDTCQWKISREMLEELMDCSNESNRKLFYSPSFGCDDNWCLICVLPQVPRQNPRGNSGSNIALGLKMLRMPTNSASVTMEMKGALIWDNEDASDDDSNSQEIAHTGGTYPLRTGLWTFKGDRNPSQLVPIAIHKLCRMRNLRFLMNIKVVSAET